MSETKAPDPTEKPPDRRKLVAVLYADMVGYSRLIGLDDVGTFQRLRSLRERLIDPAIGEHGGRIVQTGGDSLLIVFDSIDGAVRCAVKVQQQVPIHDGDQPADRAMRFRVGINTGDAIPHGTDLHGEGVNIAARLEAECPVGGVCISRAVLDQVHLDLPFEAIGPLTLKNIARPVEAFVLRLDPTAEAHAGHIPADAAQGRHPTANRRFRPALTVGIVVLLVCVAAGIGWWLVREPAAIRKASDTPPATQSNQSPRPAAATQAASLPDVGLSNAPRLSLVVLPFNTLGGEAGDDNVVDGITEDLTTDLSRVPGSLVITRNSALAYKGRPIDVKRVGEELGVRYAVEGSVRKLDDALRVNVQLVSTETGMNLWTERFDVRRDGVGYGVDDIVRQIAFTLNVRIVDVEAARNLRERPSNPDVADILLRARSIYSRPPTPQRQAELVPLYERALNLDPNSATALAGLAEALLDSLGVVEDPTAPGRIRRAEELLERAELLRHDDIMVMWVRVYLLGIQNRCEEVIPAAQRAVNANPLATGSRQWIAICLMRLGKAAEAIPVLEQAIRIAPRNPEIGTRYRWMGYALLFLERYDEAVAWFERSLAANPGQAARIRGSVHAAIAAAWALAGDRGQARLSAVEAARLSPTATVRSYLQVNITNPVAVAQVARVGYGMRLAGIRDHADEDADSGLPPDGVLHTDYEAPTPTTVPGAPTIRTPDLARLVEQRKPLVLDTVNWGRSVPGAVGLWGAGIGGNLSDEFQGRLARKMQALTGGDRNVPIVAMGFNSERFQGRNLALRLVALGYTNVFWYRGGREMWEVNAMPEIELDVQDW